MVVLTWITVVILELIHAPKPDFLEGLCLLVAKPGWTDSWTGRKWTSRLGIWGSSRCRIERGRKWERMERRRRRMMECYQ